MSIIHLGYFQVMGKLPQRGVPNPLRALRAHFALASVALLKDV